MLYNTMLIIYALKVAAISCSLTVTKASSDFISVGMGVDLQTK